MTNFEKLQTAIGEHALASQHASNARKAIDDLRIDLERSARSVNEAEAAYSDREGESLVGLADDKAVAVADKARKAANTAFAAVESKLAAAERIRPRLEQAEADALDVLRLARAAMVEEMTAGTPERLRAMWVAFVKEYVAWGKLFRYGRQDYPSGDRANLGNDESGIQAIAKQHGFRADTLQFGISGGMATLQDSEVLAMIQHAREAE